MSCPVGVPKAPPGAFDSHKQIADASAAPLETLSEPLRCVGVGKGSLRVIGPLEGTSVLAPLCAVLHI